MWVAKVSNYLAERLATIAALVDKSTPTVVALFDAIPCGEEGREDKARPSCLTLPISLPEESH